MHPEVGNIVNAQADQQSTELKADTIYQIFQSEYVNISTPLETLQIEQQTDKTGDSVHLKANVNYKGSPYKIEGKGNGPISAFVDALDQQGWKNFTLKDYRQHSIGSGSKTEAAAYVQIEHSNGKDFFGCGIDANIEKAGLKALVSAFNRANL